MAIQRIFYGWFDARRGFLVSRYPPDSPVRPAIEFETAEEAQATMKKRHRGEVMWLPALSKEALTHADQP